MDSWTTWHERARAAKRLCGKSDADLAEEVTDESGRRAGRAQVNHWFTGKREPTVGQFMALCAAMDADPRAILFGISSAPRPSIAKIHKKQT
jgi:transcriptional regulator with XRE-family HTH domain